MLYCFPKVSADDGRQNEKTNFDEAFDTFFVVVDLGIE